MNLLRQNPRLTTFLILLVAFIYCGLFTARITKILQPGSAQQTEIFIFSIPQTDDSSLSGRLNEYSALVCRRIEQAIRQTSHFIGS